MSSLPSPTVLGAFERAADRFRNSLSSEDLHLFSAVTTIEDVWDHVKYMQMEQGSRMALRNMGRIKPFIQGIEQYTKVIDTFVSAKPEILALIWVHQTHIPLL
jgi:hypothetical protein